MILIAATENSGLGHGTKGSPQGNIEEQTYPLQAAANETLSTETKSPIYVPSPKHNPAHGWGSENPILTHEEGQRLLDTGYHEGKQVYNITSDGKIVKFQPDGTPYNGYHSYEVYGPPDVPVGILRKMLNDGKITKAEYNKMRKRLK